MQVGARKEGARKRKTAGMGHEVGSAIVGPPLLVLSAGPLLPGEKEPMAKVKRVVKQPKIEEREVEVEVDDNDPTLVHERFVKAHEDSDIGIFVAAAMRKAAQHLHDGRSVQRALEMAAEEIEDIVTGARARIEDAGVEADRAQLPEEEE